MPFHRDGQKPRAPCPQCLLERGDQTPQALFGIVSAADHDDDIPADYFKVPPSKLNSDTSSTSAIRVSESCPYYIHALIEQFQWLALVRFASMMWKKNRIICQDADLLDARAQDLATSLRETREEVKTLRAKAEDAERLRERLARYKEREPEVRHYLGNVSVLAE